MAEYTKKETVKNKILRECIKAIRIRNGASVDDLADAVILAVDSVPVVDAVEIVRCKDCVHWKDDVAGCTGYVGHCEWSNYMIAHDGFCSYGERRNDG